MCRSDDKWTTKVTVFQPKNCINVRPDRKSGGDEIITYSIKIRLEDKVIRKGFGTTLHK